MSFESAVNRKAIDLGKLSVEMTTSAGSGHPSTALSLAHLVTVLMYHQMRWDPKDPWNPASDRLVLSEGHAVPIIYAALADLGAMIVPLGKGREAARPMTRADAMTLRAIDSPIDGHPHPQVGVPFFDAATGSPGAGIVRRGGTGGGGAHGQARPQHLLHHRRRREPRRANLGGRRFRRRSCPDQRHSDFQLQ